MALTQLRSWIREQVAHHPESRDAYDGRIDGIGTDWHRQDEEWHAGYLTDLTQQQSKADTAVKDTLDAHGRAVEASRTARQAWEQARLRLGLPLPPLPRPNLDAPVPVVPVFGPGPNQRALPVREVIDVEIVPPDAPDDFENSHEREPHEAHKAHDHREAHEEDLP